MIRDTLSRRTLLIAGAALVAASPLRALAQGAGPAIHVMKDPDCGCCSAWIEILEQNGFGVTVEESSPAMLARYKSENGIPLELVSCHTGKVDGYLIEGHVPPADIRRLLSERPEAVGIAVPGMPYGSPGMGPEHEREAYDVFLIRRDGGSELFARYAAA